MADAKRDGLCEMLGVAAEQSEQSVRYARRFWTAFAFACACSA